jgi:glycosyltransferase involved in cell wall biosynthesis
MVSIVMPSFNRATTLPRAIDSVLRQTETDWELIIVDDGSTDDTQDVLDSIRDPRVIRTRHTGNRGVTAALNTGLDLVRGEWFTFLGSDDEITSDALAVMLECARTTGANAVTCNCTDSTSGRMSGTGLSRDGRVTTRAATRTRGEHWGITQTDLLGGLRFDERLPGFEDTVWLLIHDVARRYYVHRALRIYHTEGEDRITVAGPRRSVAEKVRIYRALGEHRAYLKVLRRVDLPGYLQVVARIWTARLLYPFVRPPGTA